MTPRHGAVHTASMDSASKCSDSLTLGRPTVDGPENSQPALFQPCPIRESGWREVARSVHCTRTLHPWSFAIFLSSRSCGRPACE